MPVDDANTIVLLHFNGLDASTTFTDESGKVWTAAGNAQLDTAQFVFGTASGLFDNDAATHITTPYHADFLIGGINWTVDFRIRFVSIGGALVQIGTGYEARINIYHNGSAIVVSIEHNVRTFSWTPSLNTWYHIAVVKVAASNDLYVFVNGSILSASQKSYYQPVITDGLKVGNYDLGTYPLNGWIDELRISKVARWTTNFTPPTSEYIKPPYEETISESLVTSDLIMSNMWAEINESLVLAEILAERYLLSIEDPLIMTGYSRGGFLYDKEVESILTMNSIDLFVFVLAIAETLDIVDENNYGIFEEIFDSIILSDLARATDFVVILDAIFGYDNAIPGWHKTAEDGFDAADIITKVLGVHCPDSLTLNDSIVVGWKGQEIINEILGCYGLAIGIHRFNKVIEDATDITDIVTYRLIVTILENILFTSLAAATNIFVETITDESALIDEITRGFDKSIDESLVSTDINSVITSFFNTLSEGLGSTDVSSMTSRFWSSINESLIFTDVIISKGILYDVVRETLGFLAIVEFEGETWETYVLNTPKFYPSMYSSFNFNSYCVFENRAFGANEDGIYELTGETDIGETIHTGVVLNDTDFGSPNQKRFRRGYLSISGTIPKMVFETEDGKREVYVIDTEGKLVISSELKSRSWKLSISDFDKIDNLKLIPVILTK